VPNHSVTGTAHSFPVVCIRTVEGRGGKKMVEEERTLKEERK
jgi:hypothetical protein